MDDVLDKVALDLGWMKLEWQDDDQGEPVGLFWTHQAEDGTECYGLVSTKNSVEQTMTGHQVRRKDPLTLYPSLWCSTCGLHGFVTNGKWSGGVSFARSFEQVTYPVAQLVETAVRGVFRVVGWKR